MINEYDRHNNYLSCLQDLDNIRGSKFLTLNIRSLLSKLDTIRIDFCDVDLDVLSLTESWLKPSVDDGLLGIKDLKFVS